MILKQFFHQESSTYTYLIADKGSRKAAFIDPVKDQLERYLQLLKELELTLEYALDTHIHADHITCLGDLRDSTGCITVMGEGSKAACISQEVSDQEKLLLGALSIVALATPGHTAESFCYLIEDCLFSGDTLLIRGCGRTDFQNGCAEHLFHSHQILLALADDTKVYPGHDYNGKASSTIGEERQHNPRLQFSKPDFIQFMDELVLPNPKLMDIAVPANQSCGQDY